MQSNIDSAPPTADIPEALRRIPILADLDDAALDRLIARGVPVDAAAGTTLLRQGDRGDFAYLLLAGAFDVLVDGPFGAHHVAELGPGEFIGEIGVLASVPRSATVIARGAARLLRLDQAALHSLLAERHDVASAIIRSLATRLSGVMRPLSDLLQAAQALEAADLDPALLDLLASRAGEMTPFAQAFGRMVRALTERRDDRQEMAMAARLQRAILPEAAPALPGILLDARVIPARTVGGDLWDAIPLPDGRLALAVADVCGKGVPAAFFMAIVRTALRAVALAGDATATAGAMLGKVNAMLAEDNREMMFVSLILVILDPCRGTLDWASAGHPPGLLLRAGGVEHLAATGPALGVLPGARFGSMATRLAPGDRLFLYSDGVTEAADPAGAMLGEAALAALLTGRRGAAPTAINDVVIAAIDAFAAGAGQSDDITCLALAWDGAAGFA